MSRLALYLLGPPRIERDGHPVDVRRRKAVALLAYLAVTGQGHSRDALATLFWPEHDQSHARAGLRRALASLKKGLGEASHHLRPALADAGPPARTSPPLPDGVVRPVRPAGRRPAPVPGM